MGVSPKEFKQRFIESLFNRGTYTRRVNDIQYVTRCPYCGDSTKNLNTGHFYIRCDFEDNYPLLYNCFKCPAQGIITKDVMIELEIDDSVLLDNSNDVNKKFSSVKGLSYHNGDIFLQFPFVLTENRIHREKIRYVEDRLGIDFSEEMCRDSKIITSLKEFLTVNKISGITCPPQIAQKFEDKYIGFLSYGGSHILFRDVTNTEEHSWVKYLITPQSSRNAVSYSMSSAVDVFSEEPITVNMAEGIMDILSVKYNLKQPENSVNIAICGKSYRRMINRIITQGLVGYNVNLNIYSDNDEKFNKKKGNFDTSLPFLTKTLKEYTYLFNEVYVNYNTAYKDCGTTRENIRLRRNRL